MRCNIILVWTVLLFGASVCSGQTTATGFPTFGSFSGSTFDTVNEGALNVHFSIPVVAKTGRGLPIHYSINYDSTGWYPSYWTNGTAYAANWVPPSDTSWGWNFSQAQSYEPMSGYVTYSEYQEPPQSCQYHSMIIRQNYTYHDPQGTAHGYHSTALEADCYANQSHGFGSPESAFDQSGYSLYVDSSLAASVIAPDGTLIHPPEFISNVGQQVQGGSTANPTLPGMVTDVNGNQITYSGSNYTDTLGVVAVAATSNSVKYPSPTSPSTYVGATVNYTNYTVRTNFGCSGVTDYPATLVALVSSIVLADGSQYTFGYEPTPGYAGDVTSRISSITLPSGGTISYKYTPSMNNGIVCADGSAAMLTRTTPDGTTKYTRSVTQTAFGTNGPGQVTSSVTTETDPLGNKTIVNFGNNDSYEIKRQIYNGSSTLLETIETCLGVSFPCTAAGVRPFTSRTVRHEFPDSTGKVSQTYTLYTPGGEVTDIYDYDFGTASPGVLLRHTNTTYASLSPSIFYDVNNPSTSEQVSVTDRPSVVTVYDGSGNTMAQTTYAYDETPPTSTSGIPSHVPVTGSRGDPTTITQLVQGTTTIHRTKTYYDTGTLSTEVDANGNQPATYAYGTGSCGGAFATKVTNAAGSNTLFSWDCNGGVMTGTTDPNNQTTSYSWTDPNYWRLTQITYPDGGQKTAAYNTSTTPWNIIQTTKSTSTQNLTTKTIYDSQARVSQHQLTSDSDGTTYTDTTYDGNRRVKSVSNPYRSTSESTYGLTSYLYDGLGRPTSVTEPDNSVVTTSYSANQTSVTDEAGNQRKSQVDGLGRLTAMWEAPNTSGYNFETDYQYDALGNLICAVQKGTDTTAFTNCGSAYATWRPRSFTYDSLSRLLTASNPESGTITYTYDNNGNLKTKTAPKPNQTGTATVVSTYSYDALNRLTQKSYNDGTTPTVKYGYDGIALTGCTVSQPVLTDSNPIGNRTDMCDGSGSTAWSHDAMGRTLIKKEKVDTFFQATTNAYNFDGSLKTETYPTSHVMQYGYNGAGRPISLTDTTSSVNYVSACSTAPCYSPNGALMQVRYGVTGTFAGITEQNDYNKRLQPVTLSDAAPSQTVFSISYDFHLGNNNGNVFQIVNNRDNNRTQNFLYDPLNRIQQAYTSGLNWGETFSPTATAPGVVPSTLGIDAWGNLTNRSGVTGKNMFESLSAAATTQNRLSGYGYDSAGNMISNGSATYTYDAENQLIRAGGYTYTYDGDGNRIKKTTGTAGAIYWRDASGNSIDEGNLSDLMQNEYIFFDGKRIAREDVQTGHRHYYFSDHLGSASVITSDLGVIQEESDYYPYGGEFSIANGDSNVYKFTGKERDSESGLDNFGARYNASTIGRFMSPDPGNVGVNRLKPQSWNAYSYTLNNPLSLTDPTGLYVCEDSTKCDSKNDQAFAKSLADAQTAANNLTGDDKANAQRAIDSYGAQGVDNGVNVRFDANVTGGVTEVSGVANGNKSADNPTGQNINVTFNPKAVGGDFSGGLVGHEGSHVADASAWVASGFSPSMNPTNSTTEFNAYHVQFNIGNTLLNMKAGPGGNYSGYFNVPPNGQVNWKKGDTFKVITPDLQQKLKENYQNLNSPAFTKGAVLQP